MNKELSNFATRLRGLISTEGRVIRVPDFEIRNGDSCHSSLRSDAVFNQFALELFALQFQYNATYRKICEARHGTPERVEHWTQIPVVPTTAFKELELSCIPPGERATVFHSSGTTEQRPSRHFHCAESLALYEASLLAWFLPNVLGDLRFTIYDLRLICLTACPADAPHASLVHMFETIQRKPGGASVPASRFPFFGKVEKNGTWTLDFDAVLAALSENLKSEFRTPKLIMGTAFSFVHLLDYLLERDLKVELPAGSRVMETGGYKNRSRTMPKAELHALITERLGVPSEHIICEYGMSELSSQAYALGAPASRRQLPLFHSQKHAGETPAFPGHFRFPPWARAQIISPETGREVADGETGLIRVFDLANVFSVMAVQTEDLGIRHGDGFELLGRAQEAEPRGCSLMTV